MSRTTRHIPFDRRRSTWEATRIGLGDTSYLTPDPRDKLDNGYDGGYRSYHYGPDMYKECYSIRSRRFLKRWMAHRNRRKWSATIKRELEEE